MDDLKRSTKILLGAATLWPFFYMFLFMGFMLLMFLSIVLGDKPDEPPWFFFAIFPVHIFTILFQFVLIGIYIYHVFKTSRIPDDKRALWAVVIFLGNMIAMPVYFYLYIWKDPDPHPPAQPYQPPEAPSPQA